MMPDADASPISEADATGGQTGLQEVRLRTNLLSRSFADVDISKPFFEEVPLLS